MSSFDPSPVDPVVSGQNGAAELAQRYLPSISTDASILANIPFNASSGVQKLATKLKVSFIDSMKNGCNPNAGYDEVNFIHAAEITAAVDEWVKSCKLTTLGTVLPGMFRTANVGFNAVPTFFSGSGTITTTAAPALELAIKAELDIAILSGEADDANPQQIADQLGAGMANAFLAYSKSCVCVFVGKNVTPYMTTGMLPAITPEFMKQGELFGGTGTGGGPLGLTALEASVPILAAAISQAYMTRGQLGAADDANSVDVAATWGSLMADAIYVFFSSSVVVGAHVFKGGATKFAKFGPGMSLMVVPPSPVPNAPTMPPAITLPGATSIGVGAFK